MHKDSAAAHATHDELLIARLFGDDVDEQERARALAQMDACVACGDFFADLGAIARATAAMRTPPRPRDFTLSPADAARLGRPRRSWATILGWGRARALGGSMVAAGFVGVALIGAITMFAPGASSTPVAYAAQADGGNRAPGASAAPQYELSSAGSLASPAGSGPYLDGGGSVITGDGSGKLTPVPATTASIGTMAALAVGSPGPEGSPDGGTTKSGGNDDSNGQPSAAPSSAAAGPGSPGETSPQSTSSGGTASGGGLDLRLVALAGFAALAALGLIVLLAPRRLSSRPADR